MKNIETPQEQPATVPNAPPTPAQNAMLTIKLLLGAGLLIALFWFIDTAIS